ncbi:transcriptional regulator [Bacillus sp. AFS040349]|nr:transcriptional regulator [Bacillus sp. AFS040349]PGT81583.1 transcriptional regulator [Bacillus sp. AFS040349]
MDSFLSKALEVLSFTEKERKALWLIAGHSCKVAGVSWLKVQTIADALEVSYKTAQRVLSSLKGKGIIKRVRTLREVSGGFGASLTLICPVDLSYREEALKPATEKAETANKKKETFFLKAFQKDIKDIRQQEELDYTYLTEFVPQDFIETAKPFVSAQEVYTLWGKAQAVARKYAPDVLEVTEPAIRAFKASVLAYKMRRIKGSFGGYFWGALSGVFSVEQRKKNSTLLSFNWLEE